MITGECVNDDTVKCDCGKILKIGVYKSNAGYYIGFWCDNCGPYSRESNYYKTRAEAQQCLDKDCYFR